MFLHILRVRPMMTIGAVMALSTSIVACSAPEADQEFDAGTSQEQLQAGPRSNEPPGIPSFHVAPHARQADTPDARARLANGYHYAQGQFDDATYYGIYTYIDSNWTYASMSIWGSDGSSMSSGMDVSATGETWLQTGSYYVDVDGTAKGDYATTFIDGDGAGTLYLTDFESSADRASYRSTIDHSNTGASPDCLYDSFWESAASESTQECSRDDGSKWSCHYTYVYTPKEDGFGQIVSVEYRSEQQCLDSRFPDRAPAYHYQDVMTWDYVSGEYSDMAVLSCYEDDGTRRQFSYSYSAGVGTWFDENGAVAPLGPTCGWNVGNAL